MQQKSNHWSEKNFRQIIHWFHTSFLAFINAPFKNDITEIQWIFGLKFFQTSDLTFEAHTNLRFYFNSVG